MKTPFMLSLTLRIEVDAIKYVKSHTRVVNGKVVKVRSHYRRIGA